MNDPQIIAAIIALFGIGLGSVLAGLGFLWKSRADDKRKRKIVLFNLLEIWHRVKTASFDSTQITEEYIRTVNKIFKRKYGIEFERHSKDLFPIVHSLMKGLITSSNCGVESLQDSFRCCVKELSEQSPLLAHRINGRENVNQLLAQIDEYNAGILNAYKHDTPDFELLSEMQRTTKEELVDEILCDLEKDIKSVAADIDFATWMKTSIHIRNKRGKSKNASIDDLEARLDKYMDNATQMLKTNRQQQ